LITPPTLPVSSLSLSLFASLRLLLLTLHPTSLAQTSIKYQQQRQQTTNNMNTKLMLAVAGALGLVGVIVTMTLTFQKSTRRDDETNFVGQFSASGKITGSDLVGTPVDFGEGTFAVYFARDESTKEITFELTASAKGDDGETYFASAKDGKASLWKTGEVTDPEFSSLDAVDNFHLFDCDDTKIHLQSWSEQYTVSKNGDVVTLGLGDPGNVFFTLGSDGVPAQIHWGGVTGTVESFVQDASLKGTLGMDVPEAYPCLYDIPDVLEDASGLPEVDEADAQAIIDALGRRLESEDDGSMRRLGTSIDYQMVLMASAAYNNNDCGSSGWQPWFSMNNNNAYAQVCWSGSSSNMCTISFRGSDDGSDWYSNIIGGLQTSKLGSYDVPSGFLTEYNKVKSTSTWATWNWAKSSSYCSGGVYVTGHSLGAAMATLMSLDQNLPNVYTFAAPKGALNAQGKCDGKRYFISNDPVPGLPPWGKHTSTGHKLEGVNNWFSVDYRVVNEGCGSNGGGGYNPFQHSSSQYEWYINKVVG
jgi:hypothetical protein